ncbi:hypothetical protein [Candidatus Enterovibrio escicola]|uniref:Uncharacterized protein n=2 Tax=Candidatus Enterovibrio escicola TaxID=1927127 RepID=A0A2A5T0M1_9GAMM|nr:hypothetical protein [Candidatus Enterovibrio escacola]PCS21691.1 hypothetical protein BTN49_2703 [Candidatus Enterovibrio escacola]
MKLRCGDKLKIKNRVGIKTCPDIADKKAELGHFNIDTIVGTWGQVFSAYCS